MIVNGHRYKIEVGNYFDVELPDGTVLSVDCTQDDFSVVCQEGFVVYRAPISDAAKQQDEELRSLSDAECAAAAAAAERYPQGFGFSWLSDFRTDECGVAAMRLNSGESKRECG